MLSVPTSDPRVPNSDPSKAGVTGGKGERNQEQGLGVTGSHLGSDCRMGVEVHHWHQSRQKGVQPQVRGEAGKG